jgi:hypothetical protein
MKNVNTEIYQNPIKTTLQKIVFLIFLNIISIQVYSSNTPTIINKISSTATNPVYAEILNKINHNKCFAVKVTSVSVKNNTYAFTSFAKGFLEKKNTYNLTIKDLTTEFDDRNNFQGAKTHESFDIYNSGNAVGVDLHLKTWGNKTLRLANVKIKKERFGYFITGSVTDGNRTVYYTVGIYETDCLI